LSGARGKIAPIAGDRLSDDGCVPASHTAPEFAGATYSDLAPPIAT